LPLIKMFFSLDKVPFNGCVNLCKMDMGEPFGKASGRTFIYVKHLRSRPLLEFTLGDILPLP
jgi:hypothetical protein